MENKRRVKLIIVITMLILFQSLIYFLTKFLQGEPNILTSNFDERLPFISQFVYFYIAWYVMLLVIPYLIYKNGKEEFYKYLTTYIISIIICGMIFVIFPTTVIKPIIEENNISNKLVQLIYIMDFPIINCLPSIHCLISYLYMFGITKTKMTRQNKCIVYIVSVLIVLSTLFIKQHVIYDAIVSLIIASIVWKLVCSFKLYKNAEKLLNKIGL